MAVMAVADALEVIAQVGAVEAEVIARAEVTKTAEVVVEAVETVEVAEITPVRPTP